MSETAQGSRHVTTIFQETLGRDLTKLIVEELRGQPNHWLRMDGEDQGRALERIRGKVRDAVIDCSAIIMSTNFPMVKAELDGITIKDGVRISLTMAQGDPNRHALYDAKGTQCLLVMGSAEDWLERMDEVKAMADQKDLFDGDYDPKQDQPGYRRDQSPTKPSGKSWAQIKADFNQGLLTKSEAEKEYGGALPDTDPTPNLLDVKGKDQVGGLLEGTVEYRSLQTDEPNSWSEWMVIPADQLPAIDDEETLREALTSIHSPITSEFRFTPAAAPTAEDPADIERRVAIANLHHTLNGIGMSISLGGVQALSPEQRVHAMDWLVMYLSWADTPKRKKKDMPKRPHFLPLFDPLPQVDPPKGGDPEPRDGETPQ
jgi:hypothetical protein